jgi:hypothetical protein
MRGRLQSGAPRRVTATSTSGIIATTRTGGHPISNGDFRAVTLRNTAEVKMLRATLLIACIALAGCSVWTRTKSGAWFEPHEYWRHCDERFARSRAEQRGYVTVRECYPGADSDFRQGFIQAYVDVALGGDGMLPPVPPERYWKTCERDPEGYCEADHWFAGYTAGARHALSSSWHAHNQVPSSGVYCE